MLCCRPCGNQQLLPWWHAAPRTKKTPPTTGSATSEAMPNASFSSPSHAKLEAMPSASLSCPSHAKLPHEAMSNASVASLSCAQQNQAEDWSERLKQAEREADDLEERPEQM